MKTVTARQIEALRLIARSIRDRGVSPTLGEIGRPMGISSNGVNTHLLALESKGFLEHRGAAPGRHFIARCWSVTPAGWALLAEKPARLVPLEPATHTLVDPTRCRDCGADTFAAHPEWLCRALAAQEVAS